MGIIIRQSVKSTIVNFVGVGVAAISTLFIYPHFDEIYGLAQFLMGAAALLVPFTSFGLGNSVIKFFPKFQTDDKSNHGMLSMLILGFVIVYSFSLLFLFVFRYSIFSWFQDIGIDKQGRIPEYISVILIMTAIMIFNQILISYSTSNKRIVVPQLISDLGQKLFLPISILIFGSLAVSKMTFAVWLIGFYLFVSLMMLLYLLYLGVFKLAKPDWSFLTKKLKGEIFQYGLFSSWSQIGSTLAFRVDLVMIPMLLTFSSNGIYAIMLFLSNVIVLPARAVRAIASPIISESWETGDVSMINTIYKKSALNLVIPGVAILIFIWFSFDGIAGISSDPEKYAAGKYAFLFLGLGKLLDLFTSVNDQIIVYSPKYKYNLIFVLILGVLNVILNVILIEEYGITGAAIASCIAYAVYNAIKLLFILYHYKLQPFSFSLVKVLIIGIGLAMVLYFLPNVDIALGEILLNGMFIAILYFPTIYFLNISPDFNKLCNIAIKKVTNLI